MTGARTRAALRDVSLSGFAFASDGSITRLHHGMPVRALELLLPGQPALRLDEGLVRFVEGDVVGVRLDVDAGPQSALAAALEGILYPRTSVGSGWTDATWGLYERAGYFALGQKSPRDFDALRSAFARASEKIAAAPHVGVQVVWPVAGSEVAAALTMFRLYPRAWCGYQMAKVSGDAPDGTRGRIVLRDVHLRAYEHVQRDSRARWLLGFVQVKRVWSRWAHYELPRRYLRTGLAALVRFRALEVDADVAARGDARFTVDEASSVERAAFFHHVAATRPRAYVDALDLRAGTVTSSEHAAELSAAGFHRERRILVARGSGAAALIEAIDDGVHVFRMFDSVRLYALDANGYEAFPALLDAARAFYRARGKSRFVCMLEEEDANRPEVVPSDGVSDMGLADLTILSTALLPELLEHVTEITAPAARGA